MQSTMMKASLVNKGMCFLLLLVLSFEFTSLAIADVNKAPSVQIALDTSKSMRNIFPEVLEAVVQFVSQLPTGSQLRVVSFDSEANVIAESEWISDQQREAIIQRLKQLRAEGKWTDYGKLFEKIQEQKSSVGEIVVIFSDGLSDPEPGRPFVDVVKHSSELFPSSSGASVFLIGLNSEAKLSREALQNASNVVFLSLDITAVDRLMEVLSQKVMELSSPQTAQSAREDVANRALGVGEDHEISKVIPPIPGTSPTQPPVSLSDRVIKEITRFSPFIVGAGVLLLAFAIGLSLNNQVSQRRNELMRLQKERKAILEKHAKLPAQKLIQLSVVGSKLQKSWPLKPLSTLRFGTSSEADFHITDPDMGKIEGEVQVNDLGQAFLVNGQSTFPFSIQNTSGNENKIEVPPKNRSPLPNRAIVQVAKKVELKFDVVNKASSRHGQESVEDLVKKYLPKKEEEPVREANVQP